MIKNKRVLTSVFGAFVLAFLFTAAPVLAAEVDVTASNEETGADSSNTNDTDYDNSGDVTVKNDGDVDNVASAKVNTGKNDQNMNTTGGDLKSGGVDASTDWESVVNDGFGLCGCPFGDDDATIKADFENMLTGYDSDNHNTLSVKDRSDISVRNLADILNSFGLTANTGKNDQNMNTTAGDTETGDVMAAIGISNWANIGDGGSSSHGGGLEVDFAASNDTTGADSDNTNTVTVDNSGDVTLRNKANLDNVITVKANTGKNDQNKNTTAGDIDTGDVDVVTDIQNIANTGTCCIDKSTTKVDVDSSNSTTGYDSENHNTVTVKDSGDVTVKNTADVDNTLDVTANTGGNDQNKNTTAGDTETGTVSIDFGSTTVVNSSN